MGLSSNIIELSESNDKDVIEISSKSFSENPQIPVLINKPEYTKKILSELYYLYKETGQTKSFGVIQDNKLKCVSFCVNSDSKPNINKKVKFGFLLLKTLGFKGVNQFFKCDKAKPKYRGTCLQLEFYGTLPSFQKQGFGRQMLNFLYDYAKKNNYRGVTCVTNKNKPAFKLYIKDGWIIDKEFYIDNYTFCWLRKIV